MKPGAYLVVTLFVLVPFHARGQAPTGVVSEAVTGSSGAALRETRVVASRPDTSAIRSVSTDEFREPSVLKQYRGYILGAVGFLLMQAGLIAGLLIHRRNRRATKRALRESEERFRIIADTAPVMVWRAGPNQQCDFFNKLWLEFRGRTVSEEIGQGWTEGVHPDDLEDCLKTYLGAWPGRESFRMEYRLRRADGEYRWVLATGAPSIASNGSLLGYIGSCIDITERRQAEEALRDNEALRQSHAEIEDLAGRLIAAQEDERARVARKLHDDISQRLAVISIAMSECQRSEVHASGELLEVLSAVQQQTIALTEEVRLLSHGLYPGVLEHADLVDALRIHCGEFAQQHSLNVVVDADEDLVISDLTISLCLYRVVQEALRNIANHADARQVQVSVRRVEEEVQLVVADDGKGFTLAKARGKGGGLGLRIIEERIRLVGGRLSIETAPHMGTTITVWVRNLTSAIAESAGFSV